MATWQYDLHFVPDDSKRTAGAYSFYPDGSLAIELLGRQGVDDTDLREALSLALGSPIERFPGACSWGVQEANRIDVSWSSDGIGLLQEVFVRIDARERDHGFLGLVISIAKRLGCCFLDPISQQVIPAEISALTEALDRSRASLFCRDPEAFFKASAGGA